MVSSVLIKPNPPPASMHVAVNGQCELAHTLARFFLAAQRGDSAQPFACSLLSQGYGCLPIDLDAFRTLLAAQSIGK